MCELTIILCTCPNEDTGSRLAGGLVETGLAACVNILPSVRSIYRWQGTLQDEAEVLLIAKTLAERFDEIEAWLEEHHPYDVPEVVGISADSVSGAYMRWTEDSVNHR